MALEQQKSTVMATPAIPLLILLVGSGRLQVRVINLSYLISRDWLET